jgi:hypothetical protein
VATSLSSCSWITKPSPLLSCTRADIEKALLHRDETAPRGEQAGTASVVDKFGWYSIVEVNVLAGYVVERSLTGSRPLDLPPEPIQAALHKSDSPLACHLIKLPSVVR